MRIFRWARNGVVISLVTHVVLVIASSRIMLDLDTVSNDVPLSAFLGDEDADELKLDLSPPLESMPLQQAAARDEAGAMGLAAAVAVQVTETPVPLNTSLVSAEVPSAGKDTAGDKQLGDASGNGLAGDGRGNNGASFFGRKSTAKLVAFVIDASSSMSGGRFVRALTELETSLSRLKEDQTFYVVFFTDQTFPMFWPNSQFKMLSATRQNLFRVRSWLRRCQSQGGTEPMQALHLVLKMQPDVVYFLSDGDIPAKTQEVALNSNQGSVIHTMALGVDAGAEVMRSIAQEHGGEYWFVADSQP